MEYTWDMENHYFSLLSVITTKTNLVFSAIIFIPPDPRQSKGFIRSRKVLYDGRLQLADRLMSYVIWLDVILS